MLFHSSAHGSVAAIGDSLYNAHHPKMLFTPAEVPALKTKVGDGGYDDAAYNYLRFIADSVYPAWNMDNLLYGDFGSTTLPVLGVTTYLATPKDSASENRGRDLTLYVVDNFMVDNEETGSASRLRALTYGYDLFFRTAPDSLRQHVVSEMVTYLQAMIAPPYHVWPLRPYLANHSAWVAAAVGLAAICLDGEVDPVLLDDAMDYADGIVDSLLLHQLDPGGSYKEGGLYVGWTMRHLAYYFFSRQRHDGVDYSANPRVREIENWVAYEILPEGGGHINNMNDCTWGNFPLSYNHTFFDWAQSAWGSNLAAWIWERVAGPYGFDVGLQADKVATVLWNQNLVPQDPNTVLPKSKLWEDRGLYHYRTGWQTGASSDDVMFAFFSGKFHGGHAQEDQNQFTLYGYGARFAIDHGPGTSKAKQSEAHNIILIDGKGQHNAGGSIGTDGEISAHLLNGFADFVAGDATKAYTTHSPFNDPGYPFPGSNWSWGYDGENPVLFARRNVVAVHKDGTVPYFIITDDIDKDGAAHVYEWMLHTLSTNGVDYSKSPVRITSGSSWLEVYPIGHEFDNLDISAQFYDNLTSEPDATRLSFAVTADNPHFAFLMIPGDESDTAPVVATEHMPWGSLTHLQWDTGIDDYYLFNPGGDMVEVRDVPAGRGGHRPISEPLTFVALDGNIETDATFALLRVEETGVTAYVAADATRLATGHMGLAAATDGPVSVALSASTIYIDRADADFTFYGPDVTDIVHDGQPVAFEKTNGYLTPVPEVSPYRTGTSIFSARLAQNPFNPVARVIIDMSAPAVVSAVVFDVKGRRVATLWDGPLPAGTHDLVWDAGAGGDGGVASGVYFCRVAAGSDVQTFKAVLLK